MLRQDHEVLIGSLFIFALKITCGAVLLKEFGDNFLIIPISYQPLSLFTS